MDFRSEIHNSDRNYEIPIGIPASRSDKNRAVFYFFGILFKIKLIYLLSDWFRGKIMTYLIFLFLIIKRFFPLLTVEIGFDF